MAKTYSRSALTGGASDVLDGIDGADLLDGDRAIVINGTYVYFYYLDASSGASENSPQIIAPDINPGTKRWVLQTHAYDIIVVNQTSYYWGDPDTDGSIRMYIDSGQIKAQIRASGVWGDTQTLTRFGLPGDTFIVQE